MAFKPINGPKFPEEVIKALQDTVNDLDNDLEKLAHILQWIQVYAEDAEQVRVISEAGLDILRGYAHYPGDMESPQEE